MEAMINGIRLHYLDIGKPDGMPVMLLHGMTFDHTMWHPQIEILKQQYRVVAPDLRGHGRSEAGDGQFTYRHFVDDLVALLDHLGIEKVVLCGLSMGGAISLRTVELHPERIRALILCDTTCHSDTNEARYRRENAILAIKKDGPAVFADSFLQTVFAPRSFEIHAEKIDRIRKTILSTSPLGICGALLAQAARSDTCGTLGKISVPVLILVGSEDTLTPPGVMRAMHEHIPGSEFHVISGAAHVTNLENTEEFNRYMLEFLDNRA